MTSAEFKTYRQLLGLTLKNISDITQSSLRTVSYWESQNNANVPAKAREAIVALDRSLDQSVVNMTNIVDEAIRVMVGPSYALTDAPTKITLLRYMNDKDLWMYIPEMQPLSVPTHSVMLARAKQALSAKGLEVRIKYMRPDCYKRWLAGRSDSEKARSDWADSLPWG
jgi:transcriptional regulator with XRE-family HTH domain